jgi:DNA gyrase subunit A
MPRMARRTTSASSDGSSNLGNVIDVDVSTEMQGSFLEYAYSVIYSRALPDARDGLKPVHRRILYQMDQMGLRPERGHVKSARVVGEVMGKLHPHGDGAIYDALVRMAQNFSMRLSLIDGHGNFGSLDAGPAAMRYTESRLAAAAMAMVDEADEETVDYSANYDGQLMEPIVLPAAYPNLLVNGATGIAVGMATNMPPHNLGEVVAAARYLLAHPKATLDDLMQHLPGPDLPTGGKIVGLDGIREAYETGRGSFKVRATVRIENVSPKKRGIVVTELPYTIGPEKVVERIADLVRNKKLQGISNVTDLTDGELGTQIVVEIKSAFNAEAVLEELYRQTPMEDSFFINAVALVDGQPRTMGLKELLEVYLAHRIEVVTRRSAFRRRKAQERLHLVGGLLTAIVDIDEVIQIIRSSDDAQSAKARLMQVFDLDDVQTTYILDMPLRRLTKFSRIELEKESEELKKSIAELSAILDDEKRLRKVVSDELAATAKVHDTPRRTVLLESSGASVTSAVPMEVSDDPCHVLLSSTGLVARTASDAPPTFAGKRARHDLISHSIRATAHADLGVITTHGRMHRLRAIDLPVLASNGAVSLAGGAPIAEFIRLDKGEKVLALASLTEQDAGVALGTAFGVVKRLGFDAPTNKDVWEIISLAEGDHVVGAVNLASGNEFFVFVTSDAQLLRFPAKNVRQQGRGAGGVAGIALAEDASVVFFGATEEKKEILVATIAAPSNALPGTAGSIKITPLSEFPAKGRATGGVRCHRFLKGEDHIALVGVGAAPLRGAAANGQPVEVPATLGKRDASGSPVEVPVATIMGA